MSFREGLRQIRAVAVPQVGGALSDIALLVAGAMLLLALLILDQRAPALLPLRLLLGGLYVLYVPGYALTAALFPRPGSLGLLERQLLSVGLSIAPVSLLALLLDQLPWRIDRWSIFFGQALLIGAALGAAAWRRRRLGLSGELSAPRPRRLAGWWRGLPPPERRVYALLGGALALALSAVVQILVVASPKEFFSEFYLLGAEGYAEGYPYAVSTADELAVTVGVANHERAAHAYRVELWVHDTWRSGLGQRLIALDPVRIPVGARREQALRWRMPAAGSDQQVEILLFMDGAAEPYRRLRLWVNVDPPDAR